MIKELHQKLEKKEITSLEITQKCLAKIKKDNEKLNAFLNIYEKEALEKAKEVDEKISKGKDIGLLEGIPCAVKDNICFKSKKTIASSKILENYTASYDATVIKKLSYENAIFLGKTNLDEFAMGSSTENSAFGPTKNPLDEKRVPGGSSGGSAVAVVEDMVVWALGSDTGGSIRQPANFCGCVGMKPTYGRVSRYGLIAMASSYDQIGPLAKNIEDASIVLDAISGKDEKDGTTIEKKDSFFENLNSDIKGKKIGVLREFLDNGLDERIRKDIESQIEKLKNLGAEIVEVEMPDLKNILAIYYLMVAPEVSSNLARFDGIKYGFSEALEKNSKSNDILDVYKFSRQKALGAEPKRRIILGTYALSAGYYDAYYKKAQKAREMIKWKFWEVFQKVDAILSPVSPTLPFKIGEKSDNPLEMYLADIFTVSINVAMIPALALPTGKVTEDGKELALGVQLIGKWWGEQEILNIGKALEESNSYN